MSQQVLPRTVAPAGPPDDDVERALLQARALVDAAMTGHRQRSTARSLVELAPDDESPAATVRRIAAAVRHEVVCILPAERGESGGADATLDELARVAAAGIAVRMLCAPEALRTGEGTRFVARAEACGVQVRVAQAPLPELVMVDERVALVRAPAGAGGRQALVARAPAILRTLCGLFHGAWEAARPTAEYRRLGDLRDDRTTRQILGCLGAGYKDDAAARKLGLSVRTYRRYVAELMRDMGAASRFQAGVRAAELGLLAQPPPQPAMPPSTWKTAPVM